MKAQMVKNSVIVPVGSKGGFVVKNYNALQESGCTDQVLKALVVSSYKAFIEQLLTITDNLVENQVEPPQHVLRYDDDDQYLVVAADKGTATFSDIANEISDRVGFWLSDAFASGGSKGYDHKKLGITARGAWIAVRRHFWELGIDCQNTPITAVGVGDMAGDVFGNGMLQSTKICLMAAFNHKHIFLDPTPNPETSYIERQRLFNTLGNWNDYDLSKISKGGGVYDRFAKVIEITPEVALAFNIELPELSPDELVSKILQAQVDLLFFGGIGTFVKSQIENHTTVADRANDSVRVDARMIKAKIIGEGANLGLTQLGRIEYALNGGRINTDAIDNSAGVDCSDHEVNLKIMCQVLLQKKIIHSDQRDELLSSLADEVSELVLYDNWMQTLALTRMQQESMIDINAYAILIKNLELSNNLPLRREIENIPSEEELQQRKNQHLGITRPELAILLAYSKIHLYQDMLHALQNTACFGEMYYLEYFPKRFQTEYKDYLKHHPLKVEITATVLANLIINTMGPCFVGQMSEAFRVDSLEVVRAFVEVLEQTNFSEQLQAYKAFEHDKETTLYALRRLTQNLAHFNNTIFSIIYIPSQSSWKY
jgi:glutamate dehydrogenase